MKTNIILIILLGSSLFVSNKSFAESDPNILSEAAILIDSETGQVLFEKNSGVKMYPASLTKIAKAIYAIENGNLNDLVTVSENARGVDGTRVYLEVGEEVQLRKLIQGLLINTGNDAGVAIAEHLDGSIENFATNLNSYLSSIGAKNTNFENPHGLFNLNHVTTAEDLAIITQYAIKNDELREIFGTKELGWNGLSWQTTLYSHHKMLRREIPYEGVTGGKNGYVSQSGQTLVTTAEKNDLSLIAVILKASTQQMVYDDTMELLDFGFDHYQTSYIPKGKFELNDQQFLLPTDFYFTKSSEDNVNTNITEKGLLEIVDQNQVLIASTQLEKVQKKKEELTEKEINVTENSGRTFNVETYIYTFLLVSLIITFVLFTIRYRRKRKYRHKHRWTG